MIPVGVCRYCLRPEHPSGTICSLHPDLKPIEMKASRESLREQIVNSPDLPCEAGNADIFTQSSGGNIDTPPYARIDAVITSEFGWPWEPKAQRLYAKVCDLFDAKTFPNDGVSQAGKCHGCLDGIQRIFREELCEWWHFPDNLGAYRCAEQSKNMAVATPKGV